MKKMLKIAGIVLLIIDDVNDMLQNALMSIGFSESVAGVMADVICIVIL